MDKDKPPPSDMRPKKRGRGFGTPFKKGSSANPGGRPRQFPALREACRNITEEVINHAIEMIRDKSTPAQARVRCFEMILAYGHGRPAQALAVGIGNFDAQTTHHDDEMWPSGITALLMSARAESGQDPITGRSSKLLLPPPIEGEGADEYRERLEAVVKAAPTVKKAAPALPSPAPIDVESIRTELPIEEPKPVAEPEAAPADNSAPVEEPVAKVAAPEPVEKAPPPPPQPKAPLRGAPAGFAAHYEEKVDRAAQRQADLEAMRQQLPGGQVPAQDWFRPDKEMQGQQEIVRLGRVPGSHGIRRV